MLQSIRYCTQFILGQASSLLVVGTVLINGYLGIRLGTVVFVTILAVGQCLFAFGAFVGEFWLMVAARVLIGVGGSVAFSTIDAFAAQWFKDKEVTIAFGIMNSFMCLGTAAGLYINNIIYNFCTFIVNRQLHLGVSLLLSVCIAITGVILSIVLAIMDKNAKMDVNRPNSNKFTFQKLFKFNASFWIVIMVSVVLYSAMFPFLGIAQMFLISKYHFSANAANFANLLIFLISISSPLIGLLINWTGFNIYWSLGGMAVMFFAHLLYLISDASWFIPYVANSILGLSFSCINTALWSAPSFLVSKHQLVAVYGILEVTANLGLAITNMASGQVIDNYGYFFHQLVLPLFLLVVGILLLVFLICNLFGTGNQLIMSGCKQRRIKTLSLS